MGKKLKEYVHVDGKVYGPDDDVPKKVAALITNPAAWEDAESDTTPASDKGGTSQQADPGAGTSPYDGVVKADLLKEIESRNAERPDDAKIEPASEKNADLIAALKADDEADVEAVKS